MPCSPEGLAALGAFVAGREMAWRDLRMTAGQFLACCAREDVEVLAYTRLQRGAGDEPPGVRDALAAAARRCAGEELARGAETRRVLAALLAEGVDPLVMKGTALAYGCYGTPAERPRQDTDLLVAGDRVAAARRVFSSLGYRATNLCDEVLSQFEVQRADAAGFVHAFDVHWRVSTQPVFAGVVTWEAAVRRAAGVPALGPGARRLSDADSLLLACVHPAMHHRNETRLLWLYDVHLLASRLQPSGLEAVAEDALAKRVAAICADQLSRAAAIFGTDLPPGILERLRAGRDEPSARYLASERRWRHEALAGLQATRGWRDRVRLVRGIAFPPREYVLSAYGLQGTSFGPLVLPALYLHRNARGAWRILTGKK